MELNRKNWVGYEKSKKNVSIMDDNCTALITKKILDSDDKCDMQNVRYNLHNTVNDNKMKKKLCDVQNADNADVLEQNRKCHSVQNSLNAGFTFVETLAVLSITAILVATATVSSSKIIEKAKVTATKNQIEQFCIALQSYYLDCGSFPTEEQGLSALWEKPEIHPVPENWAGPYIAKKIGYDFWNSEYEYFLETSLKKPLGTPENLPFVIISYGSDKKEGGEGSAKDIISWE